VRGCICSCIVHFSPPNNQSDFHLLGTYFRSQNSCKTQRPTSILPRNISSRSKPSFYSEIILYCCPSFTRLDWLAATPIVPTPPFCVILHHSLKSPSDTTTVSSHVYSSPQRMTKTTCPSNVAPGTTFNVGVSSSFVCGPCIRTRRRF